MKVKFIVLIVLSFLIIHCSHTYVLDQESPLEFVEQIDQMKKKIERKTGVIQTKDRKKYRAKEINVTVDSTLWFDLKTSSYESRDNSELHNIVIKDHFKSSFLGLGGGTIFGVILGSLINDRESFISAEAIYPPLGGFLLLRK